MSILYDFIFIVIFIFYFPILLIKGKWHPGFKMRFGFIPQITRLHFAKKQNIWFHAVSVGEVLAVGGLVKKIKAAFPQYQVVLSTVTPTGYQLAQSQMSEDDIVIYAPLDLSLVVRQYVRTIRPEIYISAETEIWPNLFTSLAAHRVPIVEVNGRISEKSFRNYCRMRFLFKRALQAVTVFCMQTPLDAERLKQLGVEPKKISVTGNMKFDDLSAAGGSPAPKLSYKSDELVWIAGSTHPGEDEIILDIFKSLQKEFSALRLIIAPRHIERVQDVIKLLEAKGLNPLRFSQVSDGTHSDSNAVVVVDTIGHLRGLYQLATVVFVGKSLTGQGGQNIIEPAFFAKPVVVGPHMQNFKSVVASLLEVGGIVQVSSPSELLFQMRQLLQDPQRREKTGKSAKNVIEQNQGATLKTHQIISDILENISQSAV